MAYFCSATVAEFYSAVDTVCLALGAAWLAVLIGPEQAIMAGVVPFLLGAVLKSALGAMVLKLIHGRMKRADA
ncbi:MAG: biotin transporter BioY [Thioclava marina]|nr:biotin transporter BioY [Thioclava marina]